MKKKFFILFLAIATFGLGCSHIQIDNRPLSQALQEPRRIKALSSVSSLPKKAAYHFVDWDNDGKDELITIENAPDSHQLSQIIVQAPEQGTVSGFSANLRFNYLAKFDADTDGVEDLVFEAESHDSLFFTVLPGLKSKEPRIMFFSGKQRILHGHGGHAYLRLGQTGPFDPDSVLLFILTTFSRAPRHVISYSLLQRKVQFDVPIGGIPVPPACRGDFLGNGGNQILVGTYASSNGVLVDGMDDGHSWLLLIDRRGKMIFKLAVGDYGSTLHVSPWSFSGKNGRTSALLVRHHYSKVQKEPDFVGLWSWKERENFPKIHFDQGIVPTRPLFWMNPKTGKREVLVLLTDGTLIEIDENMNIVQTKKLDFLHNVKNTALEATANLTDGIMPEFLLTEPDHFFVLDGHFNLLASYSTGHADIVSVSPQERKCIAFLEGRNLYLGKLEKNPVYYGFRLGAALLGLLLFSLGAFWVEHRKRQRFSQIYLAQNVFRAWVLENLDTGVIIFDISGRIKSFNRKARQLLGTTDQLPDGEDFSKAPMRPELREKILYILHQLEKKDSESIEESFSIPSQNTEQHLILTGERIYDEQGRLMGKAISIRDVTETLRSHEMMAWANIARRLAHEVKTPLASMLIASEKLQKLIWQLPDKAASDKMKKYLQFVFEEIQHLRELSEAMMQLTDLEAKKLQALDVNRLIRESIEHVHSLLPSEAHIHVDLGARLPQINGNAQQLNLALNNLLKNAIEALEDGDSIRVRTWLAHGLQQGGKENVPYVVVEISDSGRGMSESIQKRIFEPYFSSRERGTGLGLPIARKIIRDHNGEIFFKSQEGVGTTFWIYLPANQNGKGVHANPQESVKSD